MPYAGTQTYLTWGGHIGTGAGTEIWQCGLHLSLPDIGLVESPVPTEAQLASFYDGALNTFHHAEDTHIAPGCYLKWVKAASLNAGGAYVADEVFYEGAAIAGGNTTQDTGGPQCSVAVTLYSGSQFGRANYGRFYLPWNCANIQMANGHIALAEQTSITNRAVDFVSAVNTFAATWAGTLDLKVVNMSSVGSGATKRVTQVRVGSVKDTQRRRRNRLQEVYVVGAIT